ncbi:hypothetical protein C2845_PM06G30140 [Panicum miliaceum]|uniref:Disease resistance protein RPM1-like n=1 Tax=Panicum miliaceum TaxID=4540 RepID=A0A3L6R793_PANMI|nr:hypothetical protein C2845_PM06G30140 [Panicum miliaceum]
MEATALSVGKSVLDGALGYAKSAVAEEVALQLGVQRDHAFIREELEMMQAFLRAAHEERDDHKVLMTWVKQVRDVAYDAEDCLQDCSVHLKKPSWWRLPSTLRERHRIAKKTKELRARVEDVSQRNLRYQLVKSAAGSKSADGAELSVSAGATTMSGIEEAQRQQNKSKADLIQLISKKDEGLRVIGVWATSDVLGEKSIVKRAYDALKRNKKFQCHAWISMARPLNTAQILQDIVMQFVVDSLEEETKTHTTTSEAEDLRRLWTTKEDDLADEFRKFLNEKSYLIVVNDLSTVDEWNQIRPCFPTNNKGSRLLVYTEHVKVASLCVEPLTLLPEHKQFFPDKTLYAFYAKTTHILELKILEEKYALDLFTEKVFGEITNLNEECPELSKEAELIMKKCKGLPLAIVTIGGFLAKQPKTSMEWKILNSHISAKLEMNQGLGNIKNILNKSYDGLPYHLKPCFLYLSIFPEDHDIKLGRLVCRWTAEGYSAEVHGKSSTDIAEGQFMELIDRSMILPNKKTYFSCKVIDSCQIHDLLREISISKAAEENLVFRLEEGCSSNTNGTVRHLAVSANWKGDQGDFESMVDVSRIRSLTVFGKWRPFFISDKMRFLRVLDLQDTRDLCNHHLEHIGKLLHLRYLYLKGCRGIYHLPDSVGNMRQLQTLDIRWTGIMLPKTIVKLKQLQYLSVGGINRDRSDLLDMFLGNCAAFCIHEPTTETWRDRCAECWCVTMPALARPFSSGISLPRGARNLKALRTLGEVDISGGNTLKEIKSLTRLTKLKVQGITRNCHEFCFTLLVLRGLESLAVRGSLHGCLDDDTRLPITSAASGCAAIWSNCRHGSCASRIL